MDLPRGSSSDRVPWADIAKAFSMIMLVAWTLIGADVFLNEMLIFLRMPLFFFVSGLFALRMVTRTSFKELMRDKVTNFIFLYVVWETLLFLFRNIPQHFMNGRTLSVERQASLLWEPIFNIWFLYALAIAFLAAWLLRRVPAWIVLVASIAIYLYSIATAGWTELGFVTRLVRLFPFFWLGLVLRPLIGGVIETRYRWWPVVVGAFLVAAYFTFDPAVLPFGAVTFTVSAIGIAGLLLLARQVADFPQAAQALTYIGGSTLYIYVMHKIAIYPLEIFFARTGLPSPLRELVILAIVVPVCAYVGRRAADHPVFRHFFTAPWVEKKPRRVAPQPLAVPAE